MKKFIVYEHLFPNGKRYFGITCKTPNARWEGGTGYSKTHQPVMYYAIQKYGWENVIHKILYVNLTKEEAISIEQLLIKEYRTNCKRYGNYFGYNMTDGGEGHLGRIMSQEERTRHSERMKLRCGENCPNSRPVLCDGKRYVSLTEFKRENNFPKGNIIGWLLGRVGMPKKWYEKKLQYEDLGFDKVFLQQSPHAFVIIYDNKEFESQAKLAKFLNVSSPTITRWLNGETKIPKEIAVKGLYRRNKS